LNRRFLQTLLTLAAAAAATLAGAVSASADSSFVTVPGNPVRVNVGNQGGLQGNVGNSPTNVFFSPSATIGNSSFFLGFPSVAGDFTPGTVAGSPSSGGTSGAQFNALSQSPVVGAGTSANPLTQVTVYNVHDGTIELLRVTQTVRVVNGRRRFAVTYSIQNRTGVGIRFRGSVGADLYLEGSDSGIGFVNPGPPRIVGGINQTTGIAGGLEEITGWTSYQEARYSDIFTIIRAPGGAGFNNTIVAESVDNGVGAQWDTHHLTGLAPGATRTFEVAWNFGSPRPTFARSANVEPVRGTVLVGIRTGSTAEVSAAQVKGFTFVPLSQARQIPVGSLLDTRRGTVRVTTSTASRRTITGRFNGGIFQVIQRRRERGATELKLAGGSFRNCTARGARASALDPVAQVARRTRRRVRRLSGNGRGRFRTRGRYSAATVRGTIWSVTDRCDGTLTRVSRGSLDVRDFRRRRTIRLRARRGSRRAYFARAPG
jgi:hypothetical protein